METLVPQAVWVIVLSWNGLEDTVELLKTLIKLPVKVLVVDNNSSDGTVSAIRNLYPKVSLQVNAANLGYAEGNNVGIRIALSHGADVVVVLNNDTIIRDDFISPLLSGLQSHPYAALSPRIQYASEPGMSWFEGGELDERTGTPVHTPPTTTSQRYGGQLRRTSYLTGCCIAARATVWERVGLFDSRLFLIFEDSDWSSRARNLGVPLFVQPQSTVLHKVSRSFTGATSGLATYYYARNGIIHAARHLGLRSVAQFVYHRVLRDALKSGIQQQDLGRALLALSGLVAAVLGQRGAAGPIVRRLAEWNHRVSINRSKFS